MLVYTATFDNGKKYVGATSRGMEKRKLDHRAACAAGIRNKFYNAIRKHGWDALAWDIHGRYETAEQMFRAEIDLIKSLGSQSSGYNTTAGGQGCPGRILSDEERAKISVSQRRRFSDPAQRAATGKSQIEWIKSNPESHLANSAKRAAILRKDDTREAISTSLKRFFQADPFALGRLSAQATKTYTDHPEVREKISRALGGSPVKVWKDGVVITTYPTLSQCSRELGIRIGNISMVLNGKRNYAGGYHFTREAQ